MKIWQFIERPDYVTLLSGIAAMLAMFQAIEHHFALAASLMLVSVICDYFDGKIARAVNRQNKQFGSMLDTVTDIVSFGVAPVVFAYCVGMTSPLHMFVLLAFVVAAILRLARFHAMPYSETSFVGMPVTYNSVFIPLVYFGLIAASLDRYLTSVLLAVYVVLAILMLSSIRWIKF